MGLLGRALYSENKQRHLDRWQEKAAVTKGYTTGPECCANNTTLGWRLRAKYLKWKTMEYAHWSTQLCYECQWATSCSLHSSYQGKLIISHSPHRHRAALQSLTFPFFPFYLGPQSSNPITF